MYNQRSSFHSVSSPDTVALVVLGRAGVGWWLLPARAGAAGGRDIAGRLCRLGARGPASRLVSLGLRVATGWQRRASGASRVGLARVVRLASACRAAWRLATTLAASGNGVRWKDLCVGIGLGGWRCGVAEGDGGGLTIAEGDCRSLSGVGAAVRRLGRHSTVDRLGDGHSGNSRAGRAAREVDSGRSTAAA